MTNKQIVLKTTLGLLMKIRNLLRGFIYSEKKKEKLYTIGADKRFNVIRVR